MTSLEHDRIQVPSKLQESSTIPLPTPLVSASSCQSADALDRIIFIQNPITPISNPCRIKRFFPSLVFVLSLVCSIGSKANRHKDCSVTEADVMRSPSKSIFNIEFVWRAVF